MPVIVLALLDDSGNACMAAPVQIGATAGNEGVTFWFTVIVNVAVFAHWPAVGVNVYVVVTVLFNAGDHVPVMPLSDVVGKGASLSPEHIGATAVNVGVTFGFTVMVKVVVVAHSPAAGVNV